MKVSIIAFQVFLLGCIMGHPSPILAFVPKGQITSRGLDAAGTTSQLNMAKKIRNKQAELAKKLALAKEQNAREEGIESEGSESSGRLSDSEIKEVNDRRRFDELLKTQSASMNTVASDGYLSKQQEDAEIDAYRKFQIPVSPVSFIETDPTSYGSLQNVVLTACSRETQLLLNPSRSWSISSPKMLLGTLE